ncbi:MAG: hypothetical protein J1G06_04620 [Oscillospiraceae bacterium]|nr:hypothetical protein [Oscillospiraceae bacterium]
MTNSEIKIKRNPNGKVIAGIVSRVFRDEANKFGTDEFKLWEEFIAQYPEAKMIVSRGAKAAPKPKEERKVRPSYAAMIKFINTQENSEIHLETMNKYKNMAKINGNSYNVVVEWFNNTFKNTLDYKAVFRGVVTETTRKIEVVNTNPEVVEA